MNSLSVEINCQYVQACLKEIHAKMLRKHLHRLEQPLQDEMMKSEEEKIEEDESEEEAEGMILFLSVNFFFPVIEDNLL